jgi:putative polyhydroxyalkanoate system protein
MIAVHRRHGLGLTSAKRLAETMARRLLSDYGGSYTWQGNDLHFRRTGASGCVAVTKDSFQIRIELGFLLRPLQSRIEREVRAFCDEHFGEEGASDRRQPGRPARPRRRDTKSVRPKSGERNRP